MKRDRQQHSSHLKMWFGSAARFYILILSIGVLMTAGCAKQRAKLHLNKARKLLAQAEQREAPRLEKDSYEEARKQVEEADRLLAEKKYKQALDYATRARDKAGKTLDSARSKLAAQRLNEAKQALDVADRNNGVREDPERYKRIKELYNKAQEKQRKNKWDDVISLCDEEMREVKTLLGRLLNEANQKQTQAQLKFEEMKSVGATDYASDYVITVQDMLRTIEKHINVDRDYQGAINRADEALRKCEEGIIATKKKMAQEEISSIEEGLSDAMRKGASIHARDLLDSCNESFDTIILQYHDQKYDKVLDSAKILAPKVKNLIYITRKKSAEVRIQTLVKEIDVLVEGGARQYLPGRVEKIEEFLQKARGLFDQEQFEEAENECLSGFQEVENTASAFNDLALEAMRNSAETLEISRNVFDKMADVFIISFDVQLTGLDLEFEQNKQAMKTELDTILKNSRLTLGIAKLRQEERKYRKAIELAGEVKQSSEYVLNETYHVVAHNAIMELADQVTKRETDGAREYAPVELDRTRNLLEQSKEILARGNFKEAVRKASETRAQLALTTQELAQRAVENMNVAREEIKEAPNYRTAEFQKDELDRAERLLTEAQTALEALKLKPAVEIALDAAKVAREASQESGRIWCEKTLAEADQAIKKAEESGSLNYAAEELDEAKRFFLSAQNLAKSENYIEGKEVALRSVQKARDALYKKIINAETAINEAKSYNGWKYRYKTLSQAIVDAKMSRQFMENKNYFSSSSFAEKATLEAKDVVRESKKAAFNERVDSISEDVDKALHSGVNYYQTREIKAVYRQLADIQEEFTLENYDFMSTKLDKLEADLEHYIATTPEVLKKILEKQKQRLASQKETEAIDFAPNLMEDAEKNLKYAQIDFDNEKFPESYRDVRQAIRNLDEVDSRLNLSNYREKANQILEDMNVALSEFNNVLSLGPEVLKRFTEGPTGKGQYISIAGKMKPDRFRSVITELYHHGKQIDVPEGLENIHKDFVDMLNDVRLSSLYFEKLVILNEFEPKSRHKIIDKAFDLINSAKEKRSALQEEFLNREHQMRVAKLP